MIIRSITRPLRETVDALSAAVSGQTDLTLRLPAVGNDELAQLSRSVNRLIHGAHDVSQGTAVASGQVLRLSDDLGEVTAATQSSLDHQLLETDSLVTAMNEMVATVQDVARNAVVAADATRLAEKQPAMGITSSLGRVLVASLSARNRKVPGTFLMFFRASTDGSADQELKHGTCPVQEHR